MAGSASMVVWVKRKGFAIERMQNKTVVSWKNERTAEQGTIMGKARDIDGSIESQVFAMGLSFCIITRLLFVLPRSSV